MNTHIKKILAISLVVVMCLSALPMLAPPASASYQGQIEQGGVYQATFGGGVNKESWDGWSHVNGTLTSSGRITNVFIKGAADNAEAYIYQDFSLGSNYDVFLVADSSQATKVNDRHLISVLSSTGQLAGPAITLRLNPDGVTHSVVLLNSPTGEMVMPDISVTFTNDFPVHDGFLVEVRGDIVTVHVDGRSASLAFVKPTDAPPSQIRIGHKDTTPGATPAGYLVLGSVTVDTDPVGREKWVAIGDSITFMDHVAINETYRYAFGELAGRYVTNEGIGSETSIKIMARYSQHVAAQRPDHVIIQAGTNDIGSIAPEQTIANIQQMVDWTLEIGAHAWVMYIPPASEAITYPAVITERAQINAAIANMSSDMVHPVDIWTPLSADGDYLLDEYHVGDGIHPNAAGNLVIAQALYAEYDDWLQSQQPVDDPGIADFADKYAWLIVAAVGVVGIVVYAVAARHPVVLAISIILLAVAALLKTGVL